MTISLAQNAARVSYSVSEGVTQTSFTVSFEFFDDADLNVYVDGTKKTLTTHYSVSGGSGSTGAVAISVTGATGGSTVVITRDIALARTTDFPTSGSFQIATLNTELDRFTAIAADLKDSVDRSLQLTDYDAAATLVLPAVDDRKGKVLAFNETSGAVEAGPSTSAVQTVANNAAAVNLIGTADAISDINDLATTTNINNISSVAGIASNISTVAGIASNVTSVAGDATDIGAVAGKATEIGRLGTADAVADLALLGTSTVVSNIATVAGVASTMSAAASNASAAAASATAAANSAAAAATALDSFDDRYLGSKSSEPSVDNDGNALVSGALYFNSTSNGMKVYDGGSWINASSAGAVSLLDYEYTATAGQTTFSGSDNNSATLAYAVGNLIVTLNGIVLDNGSDYTATSGTSIVLASGAALNDHLAVVAFKSFTVADAVPASTGGTFAGNVAVTGNISVTGTVDGRDVAADGTKLDTNIPSSLGTAGQVLTVNPAGNAGSWVEASGGGEQTFTASGSITAGNIVGINSSGTVEVLGVQDSGVVQVGTMDASLIENEYMGAASNGSDKVVVAIPMSGSNLKAVVGTLNGSSISWGSEVNVTSSINRKKPKVVYDTNAGKFLYVYYDGTNNQGLYAKVGTVSGTSISFGSAFTIDSTGKDFDIVYNSDTQNTLCFYQSNTERLYAKVLTISGTSVSAGSMLTVESGANHAWPRLSYDTTANKYLGVYNDGSVGRGHGRAFTVSGTSVTMGSETQFNDASVNYLKSSYNPISNRHVTTYYSSSGGAFAIAATISGTSVTFGDKVAFPVTFFSASDYNPVLQHTQLSSYGYGFYYSVVFGSGNDITLSATSTNWVNSNLIPNNDAPPNFVNIDSSRNFWIWENGILPYSQVLNENAPKFVGLAKENISNGATGKVTVMGGINSSVSGLTAGKSYGLLPTGSAISAILPQSGDAKSIFGTALSATSIYIDKGNLR